MPRYKHIKTEKTVGEEGYSWLSPLEKPFYKEIDSSGQFITSAVIGAVTDSALLGGLLGGDIVGGIVGDLLDGDLFD